MGNNIASCIGSENKGGEKVYDCYKGLSGFVDKLLDDKIGDLIKNPIAAEKFKKLAKKALKWKNLLDNGVECAHDFAHACDHLKEKLL